MYSQRGAEATVTGLPLYCPIPPHEVLAMGEPKLLSIGSPG